MKEYLLESQIRGSLVEKSQGKIRTVNGINDLGSLIANRSFACLHYYCGPDGFLHACHEDDHLAGCKRRDQHYTDL